MKIKLVIFETKVPGWLEQLKSEYSKKIQPFNPFEIVSLKSPSADRDDAGVKRKKEAELLLKKINDADLLVLFDENGKSFANSEAFAEQVSRLLQSGKSQLVFCIGGAYGFDEVVKKRATAQWSLSGLTFNHWIAQSVVLEQIYRAFTIIKGLPYHNR